MKDVKIQFSREINQWRNLHKLQIADSFGGWMEMKIPPSLRTEKALKYFMKILKNSIIIDYVHERVLFSLLSITTTM